MTIEELLAATFTRHEHLVPDEQTVRDEIDARLHRSRPSLVRPLAIAASVLVVAGAAAGVATVSSNGPTGPAAPPAGSCAPAVAAAPATAVASQTMPFDLGYLPGGTIEWTQRGVVGTGTAAHRFYGGWYAAQINTAQRSYSVDIEQLPSSMSSGGNRSGATPVRIAGRQGYESSTGGAVPTYELVFDDARGGTMQVDVSLVGSNARTSHVAALLGAIGRQIGSHVVFPGTTQVQPTFGLGYLPAGTKVVSFLVQGGRSRCLTAPVTQASATSFTLARVGAPNDTVSIGTNLDVPRGTAQARTVQGHPTSYGVHDGYNTVQVEHAVHGQTVAISSNTESEATLYRIADGLQLPRS